MEAKAMWCYPEDGNYRQAREKEQAKKESVGGIALLSSVTDNLDLSRMDLMISGIFDQFLFKQILSLNFEVIQWLGNALDISISFSRREIF